MGKYENDYVCRTKSLGTEENIYEYVCRTNTLEKGGKPVLRVYTSVLGNKMLFSKAIRGSTCIPYHSLS